MSTKTRLWAEPGRSWRSVGEHDSEGDWARDVETSEMGEKSRYHQQENEKKKSAGQSRREIGDCRQALKDGCNRK